MKMHRIKALIYRDFLVVTHVRYRIAEEIYFPIVAVLMWGFFALYVANTAPEAGLTVLSVVVFWNYAYVVQNTVNVNMLSDLWSGSFKQLFMSGITKTEYVLARIVTGTVISFVVMGIMIVIASYFGFVAPLWIILLLMLITLMASVGLSVLIAGLIVIFGRDYGFLAFTLLQLFILLSAPFYAANIFPAFIQPVTSVMPFTNVFEGVRSMAITGALDSRFIVNGALISAAYMIISIPVYLLAFRHAKKSGKLVKLS